MDTTQLNVAIAAVATSFGNFSTDFNKFASDLGTFLKGQPQDTPKQTADIAAAVIGLQNFSAQLINIDKQMNALDASLTPAVPPVPVPPVPPVPPVAPPAPAPVA